MEQLSGAKLASWDLVNTASDRKRNSKRKLYIGDVGLDRVQTDRVQTDRVQTDLSILVENDRKFLATGRLPGRFLENSITFSRLKIWRSCTPPHDLMLT